MYSIPNNKKPLKYSDFLIVIYNKLFADAETHCL